MFFKKSPITEKDLMLFFEHLESCVAYVTLYQALHSFAPESEGGAVLKRSVLRFLKRGNQLYQAIEHTCKKYGVPLAPAEVLAIRAGEDSGDVTTALAEIIRLRKEAENLKSKVRSSLIMPTITLTVALTVFTIGIFVIIPKFQAMFMESMPEDKIPELSRMIFDLSTSAREHAWLALMVLGGAVFLIRNFVSLWSLPILDKLARLRGLTVVFFHLFLFLKTGYTSQVALDNIYRSLPDTDFYSNLRSALRRVLRQANAGVSLPVAFRKVPYFGPQVAFYFELAGQTGDYIKAMNLGVARFQKLFIYRLNIVVTLINPVLFIFTALMVGTLVAAMYIPIFQSVSVMSGG